MVGERKGGTRAGVGKQQYFGEYLFVKGWVCFSLYRGRSIFLYPHSFMPSYFSLLRPSSVPELAFPTPHFHFRVSSSEFSCLFHVFLFFILRFLSSVCAKALGSNLPRRCFDDAGWTVPLGLCCYMGDECLDGYEETTRIKLSYPVTAYCLRSLILLYVDQSSEQTNTFDNQSVRPPAGC